MTIARVAEYLKCQPSTLYRLLQSGEIPAFHIGSDWRFRRADINTWIAAREMKVRSEEQKAGSSIACGRRLKGNDGGPSLRYNELGMGPPQTPSVSGSAGRVGIG
jgi:excisionase family DNA binding protein